MGACVNAIFYTLFHIRNNRTVSNGYRLILLQATLPGGYFLNLSALVQEGFNLRVYLGAAEYSAVHFLQEGSLAFSNTSQVVNSGVHLLYLILCSLRISSRYLI